MALTPSPAPSLEPGRSLPETMRAASRRVYGSADEIEISVIARPEPGPGEVLVRVAAAALDRATLPLLEGKPYLARLALGLRRPRRTTPGQQVAGEVVALGSGATGFAPGDAVFGTAAGSFAEVALARATTLAPRPAGISESTAASLGVSGLTAHQALVESGRVRPGQSVLVLGASGAVGTYAVQLATQLGAHVTGVCSAAQTGLVQALGARRTFDYRGTPLAQMGPGFDLIIDTAGNRPVRELRSALTPNGTLVIVGGEGGGPLLGGIERNLVAAIAGRFTSQRLGFLFSTPTTQRCTDLAQLIEAGTIEAPVDRVVGLSGLRAGIEAMQRGELRGHVIIRPTAD